MVPLLVITALFITTNSYCEYTWFDFFRDWNTFNTRNRRELLNPTQFDPHSSLFDTVTPKKQSSSENVLRLNDLKGAVPQAIFDLKEFIANSEEFAALGARPPKGILLVGAPGTGKTTIVRALAHELDIPLVSAAGSQFVEIFVGTGPKRVRELFAQAREEMIERKKQHAIIFIDEIDAIGKRSEYFSGSSEDHKTLNELLTQMDGFNKDSSIIVIAATNCPKALDPALLRPGRFDEIITIELPNAAQRFEILSLYVHGAQFNRPIDPSIDLHALAQATEEWSGAELESVINKAAIHAARNKHSYIHASDMRAALTEVKKMHQSRR